MRDWLIWLIAFGTVSVPVSVLLLDRAFDVPARRLFVVLGLPALVGFVGVALYARSTGHPIGTLLLWGVVGGVLGTVALDIVRLIGVRYGAFPVDMPQVFGMIALGLAPRLQRNLIARMAETVASLPETQRRAMLAERVRVLPTLTPERRRAVIQGMLHGLRQVPEATRQAVLATQMELIAELPSEHRRTMLATMNEVMSHSADGAVLPYVQPRGMPKIPMYLARLFLETAIPRTLAETGMPAVVVLAVGYLWHFIIGAGFGAQYTLLVGRGSWVLAMGWGIFIWAGMMVAMPPMMPMIRFPRWFPVVPFIAHIAFAVPLALVTLARIDLLASASSALGLMGWLLR